MPLPAIHFSAASNEVTWLSLCAFAMPERVGGVSSGGFRAEPPKPLPDLEFLRAYAARREAERRAHEAELRKLEADKLYTSSAAAYMSDPRLCSPLRLPQPVDNKNDVWSGRSSHH